MESDEKQSKVKGIRWFFCCGGSSVEPRERKPKAPRAPRSRRRHAAGPSRRPSAPASLGKPSLLSSRGDAGHVSILSDDEWHDAQDAFSVGSVGEDGGHSPLPSIQGSPRGSASFDGGGAGSTRQCLAAGSSRAGGGGGGGDYDSSEASTASDGGAEGAGGSSGLLAGGPGLSRLVGCLSAMRQHESLAVDEAPAALTPRGSVAARSLKGLRPAAGCSMPRRPPGLDHAAAAKCWDESDATTFHIRSIDYMRTKVKVDSAPAIYRLAAADVFTCDTKASHVARSVSLPPARGAVMVGDVALPPILIFNIQLPSYSSGFFGPTDGPGQSIVYYFVLPEEFDPACFPNKAALGLLARFVANGREADGSPTRDRLKLIARVANVEEWAEQAPLSTAEHKLLVSYNEKPLMTRPQQHFFVGPNYLEVDMDVHSYAFLARKALTAYHSRLKSVVFENAFVIQGNAPDELPEQILGCTRIYRTDFERRRTLAEYAAAAAAPAPANISAAAGGVGEAAPALAGQGAAAAAAAAAAAGEGAEGAAAAGEAAAAAPSGS